MIPQNDALIAQLNKELLLSLPANSEYEALRMALAQYLNHLADTSFEQFISLLYRIDVSEARIKQLLEEPHDNAGLLMADLVIARQLEKIESRQKFSTPLPDDLSHEETW
jgi:hypothetical protein